MDTVDAPIAIVNFSPAHKYHFKKLNEEWIKEYFTLEDLDKQMLDDPEGYILDRGGYIFTALHENDVVGTCALIKLNKHTFELAKMAVAPHYRAKGIGLALGAHCIDIAKATGIRKIELLSNTLLEPAIGLYKKLGFIQTPLTDTGYRRANIKMELDLQTLVKATIVIREDLPAGLAINAASLVMLALGNRLKHLIGDEPLDRSGFPHAGLTWLPIAVLKADRETLHKLWSEAQQQKVLVLDVPEQAQQAHVYEDFTRLMSTLSCEELYYAAIGLYGNKNIVTSLTRKLALYK